MRLPDSAGPAQGGAQRNGYVRSSASPLRQDPPRGYLALLLLGGAPGGLLGGPAAAVGALASAAALLVLWGPPGWGPRLLQAASPLFSLGCAFFFLSCWLRRGAPPERGGPRLWLLALPPCCCCPPLGDALLPLLLPSSWGAPPAVAPRLLPVLACVALLALALALRLRQAVLLLLFASLVWTLSDTSLGALGPRARPLCACLAGLLGCLLALAWDPFLQPREATPARAAAAAAGGAEDKVPVIRPRRRSSCVSLGEAPSTYYGSGKMPRRPSLPCISREQVLFHSSPLEGSKSIAKVHVPIFVSEFRLRMSRFLPFGIYYSMEWDGDGCFGGEVPLCDTSLPNTYRHPIGREPDSPLMNLTPATYRC